MPIRTDLCDNMVDWLQTLPVDPPFYTHSDWPVFASVVEHDDELEYVEGYMRMFKPGHADVIADIRVNGVPE